MIRGPVGIRLTDLRPPVQEGASRDSQWIYFRAPRPAQSGYLVTTLGNALTALNAAPGYVLLDEEAPLTSARVVLSIDYEQGYARWPLDVNTRGSEVPVEGAAKIRFTMFVDGERVKSGVLSETPNDFRVPVRLIRRDNVQKVISDSLAHQYHKATTDLLDDLLWRISEEWPTSPKGF